MKRWLTFVFLIICLIDFCYVRNVFIYAQYLDDNDEDVGLRVWSLKQQIKIEEDAIKALKNRHRSIVKEKQRIQKVIERERGRVKGIEKSRGLNQKLFEAKRQKEQERQLFLLEQIMQNQAGKKKFLGQMEQRRIELEEQKHEHEKKLFKEEAGLQELELELMNQQEQIRIEGREIQMQRALEAANRIFN